MIVDAYNVLHCSHVLPEGQAMVDPPGLCRLIAASRWGRGRITVVCDGTPKTAEEPPTSTELVYAGPGRDADSWIERAIAADTAPKHLYVVTNDRRIQRAARRRRSHWIASETFLRSLVPERRPAARDVKPRGTADPAGWIAEMGLTGDELGEQPTPRPPKQAAPDPASDEVEGWLRTFGFDPADPDADLPGTD